LAHGIFVMKYWVLSKKIRQIVQEEEDKHLNVKAWIITVSLCVLILSTVTSHVFIMIKAVKDGY